MISGESLGHRAAICIADAVQANRRISCGAGIGSMILGRAPKHALGWSGRRLGADARLRLLNGKIQLMTTSAAAMQAAGQDASTDGRPRPDQLVYYFGKARTEGSTSQRELLGGKGANLAEMTSIGLPVPPGFTITTTVCEAYYKSRERLPAGLMDDVNRCIADLEKESDKTFGSESNPLLDRKSVV